MAGVLDLNPYIQTIAEHTCFVCGANFKEREAQTSRNLSELFDRKSHQSILYVGTDKRRQHFPNWFEQAGYSRIVALGAFAENAEFLKAKASSRTPALKVTHGNIRDKDVITGDAFDMYYPFEMRNYIFLQALASILHSMWDVTVHAVPSSAICKTSHAITWHADCFLANCLYCKRHTNACM